MKKYLLLLTLFVGTVLFAQEKETVYMVFEYNQPGNCNYTSSKSEKKIPLSYTQKRHRKVGTTRFIICKNTFMFDFKKDNFEVVDGAETAKYKIVDIDYLLNKLAENENKTINDLFQLYIIEKYQDNSYAKYQVLWEKALY
jgi:hypothetical protein